MTFGIVFEPVAADTLLNSSRPCGLFSISSRAYVICRSFKSLSKLRHAGHQSVTRAIMRVDSGSPIVARNFTRSPSEAKISVGMRALPALKARATATNAYIPYRYTNSPARWRGGAFRVRDGSGVIPLFIATCGHQLINAKIDQSNLVKKRATEIFYKIVAFFLQIYSFEKERELL